MTHLGVELVDFTLEFWAGGHLCILLLYFLVGVFSSGHLWIGCLDEGCLLSKQLPNSLFCRKFGYLFSIIKFHHSCWFVPSSDVLYGSMCNSIFF